MIQERVIGSRNPAEYNSRQYNKHGGLYARNNELGLRGGYTPEERVQNVGQVAPPGSRLFEAGPGPGHEAPLFVQKGYKYKAGDISRYFINGLRAKGFEAIYFDASKDSIPKGIDVIYAHMSLYHFPPIDLVRFLANCRERLEGPKAFYASFLEGWGHERSERNEQFPRVFFYYPQKRLEQIFRDEGMHFRMERAIAFNGTVFWHVWGRFREDFEGLSYGTENIHPFGDVFWTPGAIFEEKNPLYELMEAQAQTGMLDPEKISIIKRLEDLLYRGVVTARDANEFSKAIHDTWAEGLKGRDVERVMQHAKDYIAGKRLRRLTEAAFAVCNNNGFNNILAGIEPSWLMNVLAEHLHIDYVASAQWETASGTQFKGELTGEVFYPHDNADPGKLVANYERQLRNKLGLLDKRPAIGVGHSCWDDALLKETDYPIYVYPDRVTVYSAHGLFNNEKGVFTDCNGQPIYSAPSEYWLRWAILDRPKKVVEYLNMTTSGRHPIEPNPQFIGPSWMCPDNRLNLDFYQANQTHIRIAS